MWKVTSVLKAYAARHLGVAADASDALIRATLIKAVKDGKLAPAEFKKMLGRQPVPTGARRMPPRPTGRRSAPPVRRPAVPVRQITPEQIQKQIDAGVTKAMEERDRREKARAATTAGVTPTATYSKAVQVRVKSAADRYARTQKAAVFPERTGRFGNGGRHPLAGQDATHQGRKMYHPSDLDTAVAGAYLKFCITQQMQKSDVPPSLRMTDHDNELLKHALHEMEWTGLFRGTDTDAGALSIHKKKLSDMHIKALLDDSVSGGIEAAPIAFDDAVIIYPVLYGELFPHVNVVNVTRGRRMKGAVMQNPSFTSGIAEGTAIQPFNTATFVSAFDTPIFAAVSAFEIGLDFEEDSPVDLGSKITEQYGLKALEWLDRVVAVGDGVTEPTGIFTATGTTTVLSDNGAGGPATVSDYEGLMFGVEKRFRNEPGAVLAYIANDTMYRRSRAIPVGPGDERRVFGMTHGDYTLLNAPYKVQNDIPNGKVAYGNLKRYRMYRRLGLNVRVETQGRSLAINNTKLLVLRMRYGGQPELGGAYAVMTDAQF